MKKLFKSFFLSFIQMKKSKTTFNKFPKDFYRLLEKEKEELSFRTVTFWEWIPQWGDNIKKVFDFQLRIFLSHITPILKCFAFGTMILMGMSHWQIIIKVKSLDCRCELASASKNAKLGVELLLSPTLPFVKTKQI